MKRGSLQQRTTKARVVASGLELIHRNRAEDGLIHPHHLGDGQAQGEAEFSGPLAISRAAGLGGPWEQTCLSP